MQSVSLHYPDEKLTWEARPNPNWSFLDKYAKKIFHLPFSNSRAIDDFWLWFNEHSDNFDDLADAEDPFWDIAIGQLQRLYEHLWFELSCPNNGVREFIITAEGHEEGFPLVEAIVAGAPKLSRWQFIALKPPKGFDFKMTYEGITFDPRSMWFLPLEDHLPNLGLRIGVPNYSPAVERQTHNAVLIILDTALGERVATLDIQHTEVSALPESPGTENYIGLCELPNFIECRKQRNGKAESSS